MSRSLGRSRWLLAILSCAGVLAVASSTAGATTYPAKVGPPNAMTALGDSITRGFHAGSGLTCFPYILTDCPARSWSSGTDSAVNSLYLRIRAINSTINGRNFNDAVTGAKVGDLPGQVANAVARSPKPELVTILIGANDACTSTEAGMTTVADFRTRIRAALSQLTAGLPDARIQVASVPDLKRLWEIGKDSSSARSAWSTYGICQSILANPTSTAQADVDRRDRVRQRVIAFNGELASACAQIVRCRYDGGAAFGTQFVLADMSSIDYFHPNTQGQAKAAAVEWAAGFNYADLTAPVSAISTDRDPDGVDGWYRDNVTATITATDAAGVSGSEYYYKLVGAADRPWTRYTGPFTIGDEGATEITFRSVDVNGNVEASQARTIKIDKTAPSFTLACPSTSLELNSAATYAISGAADDRSGFLSDPNGTYDLDTSTPGENPNVVQIQDRAGNTATRSCSYDVHYPTPGVPALAAGDASPNLGAFGLAWTPSADGSVYHGLRYALQHRDADDADWSDVGGPLADPALTFETGTPEDEGTWHYRVRAVDGALATPYSGASDAVKVDRTAPAAPSLTADRSPDYADWFKDTVTVSFADNGDPVLPDGSAGAGIDADGVPGPVTRSATGDYTISGTVKDRLGNESAAAALGVKVDATDPSLSVVCPVAVLLHATATATVSAADGQSGLAADPSGIRAIATGAVGTQTTSALAVDNVRHSTAASCDTAVRYLFGGVQQPVNPDGSSVFKLGSTVPVKFALTDAASARLGGAAATLTLAKVTDNVEGTELEATSTAAATTGNAFRYDASGQQYIYNLATKGLTAGTYRLRITLDDGTSYAQRISLR